MKQLNYQQYKKIQRRETIINAIKTVLLIVFIVMTFLMLGH